MLVKVVYGRGGVDKTKPFDNAVAWWDGANRTVTQIVDGEPVVRNFTPEEDAILDAQEATSDQQADRDQWRQDLAAGIADLRDARAAALAAVAGAQSASSQVAGYQDALATLVAQSGSLASSGSTPEVRSLATGIKQLAQWAAAVNPLLKGTFDWGAQVDQALAKSYSATIYLANLAQETRQ